MKWILPKTYTNPLYPFERSPDHDATLAVKHPVVIVGAGPTGLTSAIDLANRGIPSVILSKEKTVSIGSRAICFAKKTLEVVYRLNPDAAKKMLDKGITWNIGKVFYQEEEVYQFNLLPEDGHKIPAFINLQQYYFEEYLVNEIYKNPLIDIRWHSTLKNVHQDKDKVSLEIETPEGDYGLEADYLLACDGVHSKTRKCLEIPYEGEMFEENFLIADVTMENDFPTERWFWFDPPFNEGYSALLHKEPDGVWRIDLQLGRDIDKDVELNPQKIKLRLQQMLGADCEFKLEWTSIYNFRCMRLKQMIHDRIIFAGDSAHQVSPFGARGANGGVQDVDNLIWKLAYVINGKAPKSLLETYHEERSPAADENIYHSSSATNFISPKSKVSAIFRNETLKLAKHHEFAQKLVNSGRLSHAFKYLDSSLTTADIDTWVSRLQPGCTFKDVTLLKNGIKTHLIDLLGYDFTLLIYGKAKIDISALSSAFNIKIVRISSDRNSKEYFDLHSEFKTRYDVTNGSWYILRPDNYVAGRGKNLEYDRINKTVLQATAKFEDKSNSVSILDDNPMYEQDEMYKSLIESHEGLTYEESTRMNVQLILLLMESTGDKVKWNNLLLKASKGFEKSKIEV